MDFNFGYSYLWEIIMQYNGVVFMRVKYII